MLAKRSYPYGGCKGNPKSHTGLPVQPGPQRAPGTSATHRPVRRADTKVTAESTKRCLRIADCGLRSVWIRNPQLRPASYGGLKQFVNFIHLVGQDLHLIFDLALKAASFLSALLKLAYLSGEFLQL